jgi:uncharacterized membrane protein
MMRRRADRSTAGNLARMEILGGILGSMLVGSSLERALIGLIAGVIGGLVAYAVTHTRRGAPAHPRSRFAGELFGVRSPRYHET